MQHFLPQDYEAPRGVSGYMKLEDGENRIRILSAPILGWEDWKDKKPLRYRFDDKPDKPIDSTKPLKHFWAFIVWNYKTQLIQVLEVTQASIRKRIEALCQDDDWGAPYSYDIKIVKSGESIDTEYAVNPTPHKQVDPAILIAFKEKPIFLDALFDNGDPFAEGQAQYTKGYFQEAEAPKASFAKKSSSVVIEATPEGAIPDEVVDIEYFMDFMPEHATRDTVEAFVAVCAKTCKKTPELYMAETLDNIDKFVGYYDQWNEKQSSRVTA
jgi:hypothetical protein